MPTKLHTHKSSVLTTSLEALVNAGLLFHSDCPFGRYRKGKVGSDSLLQAIVGTKIPPFDVGIELGWVMTDSNALPDRSITLY